MPILTERSSIGNISAGKSSLIMTRKQGISMFEGRHNEFDVKTLPVPKTGVSHVNYLSGVNLVIPRGSDSPQDALALLKWMTQPEKQLEYAAKSEVFPALESSFEKFLLSSPQRLQNYTNIIAGARTLPNHIATGTIMEVMANIMSAVASSIIMHKYGPETLKEQLKKAKEEVEGILSLYNE
jgi:trehalose/maltose transport system substrate-binding protein